MPHKSRSYATGPCAIGNSCLGNLHSVFGSWRRLVLMAVALAFALTIVGTPPLHAQSYQDLHDFSCATGCSPDNYGPLRLGADGYLYGTTTAGGTNNLGTIFKILPAGTGYTVLWNFDGTPTGSGPTAGLTLATDGNFYGTAFEGGSSNAGTLFSFNPKTSVVTVLHNFVKGDGGYPEVPPIEAKDFNLYGTTDDGATYRLTLSTKAFSLLSPPGTLADGQGGPMFLASDGFMYGTTYHGGGSEDGTIFRMNTSGVPKIIHQFTGSDGASAVGTLVQGKDGNLYGTTLYGGPVSNSGSVFKLVPKAPFTVTTVVGFDVLSGGINVDGANPTPGLATVNGTFYGATSAGGANSFGTLFEIQAGTFFKFFDFTGNVGTIWGNSATSDLFSNTDGLLYGVTISGGANGVGVLYSLTPPNPTQNVTLCCNWWVILDQPVIVLGNNLTGVVSVSFGSVAAQFQPGSATYLTADVPSAAIDGPITVTLATGAQLQSQQNVLISPKITNLNPSSGPVGTQVNITGGGFAGTTKVKFGGVATGNFVQISPSLIQATVPSGAVTGKVDVVTPNGTAASKQTFTVN
jgi:uncharacterized repeat protein (TIGR03803 family)